MKSIDTGLAHNKDMIAVTVDVSPGIKLDQWLRPWIFWQWAGGRLKARLIGWAGSRDKPGDAHPLSSFIIRFLGHAKEEGMRCGNYLDNTRFLRKHKEPLGRDKAIIGCIVLGITTPEKNPSY